MGDAKEKALKSLRVERYAQEGVRRNGQIWCGGMAYANRNKALRCGELANDKVFNGLRVLTAIAVRTGER